MKNLFVISSSVHGRGGGVLVAWHPQSIYLAITGSSSQVTIYHRNGTEVSSFTLPKFESLLKKYSLLFPQIFIYSPSVNANIFVGIKMERC